MAFINAGNVLAGAGGLALLGTVVDSGVVDSGVIDAGGGSVHLGDHGVPVAHLRFDGSYTAANFNIGSDGHGGTLIGFLA